MCDSNMKLILLVLLMAVCSGLGKVYNRCELARELIYTHRISVAEAALWVCIAYNESSLNSAAVGRLNRDGSSDHGLFQFSDRWWCGRRGQIPCDQLRDSNLQDDLLLARAVWRVQGLRAWVTYPKCKHSVLRYIAYCF